MAIIYTYPTKASPAADDLILISDSADSNKTKQIKVSALPSSGAGITLTTNDTSGVATLTGTVLNIPNYTTTGGTPATPLNSVQFNNASAFGGSADLTFATNTLTLTDTLDIKGDGTNPGTLKLYCENVGTPHAVSILGPVHTGATPYSIRLPKEIATQSVYSSGGRILESDASGALQWIVTPTGSGGVSSFTNTNGTFISAGTANSSATGAVTMGTIDLSATGTASNTTFLRGDNTWATPTGSGGISFSGSTANGIATYSSATQANVSSVFTVSGNKLSAPSGTEADPSVEVGAVGGLYAASGGIFLAHSGASAIGVNSTSIVNYKITQFNAGLKFGVSGSTLSTYTEATWTGGPTLTFSVGGAATLSASAGSYRVIGDMVFAQFQFTFSSGGYGTADLSLPVSGVAGTGSINFAKMNSSLSNSTVSTPVTGDILTNAASIRLKSFNYDQDSGSHVSGQLFELVDSAGQPIFQSGDVVSGTIIYRKA